METASDLIDRIKSGEKLSAQDILDNFLSGAMKDSEGNFELMPDGVEASKEEQGAYEQHITSLLSTGFCAGAIFGMMSLLAAAEVDSSAMDPFELSKQFSEILNKFNNNAE